MNLKLQISVMSAINGVCFGWTCGFIIWVMLTMPTTPLLIGSCLLIFLFAVFISRKTRRAIYELEKLLLEELLEEIEEDEQEL